MSDKSYALSFQFKTSQSDVQEFLTVPVVEILPKLFFINATFNLDVISKCQFDFRLLIDNHDGGLCGWTEIHHIMDIKDSAIHTSLDQQVLLDQIPQMDLLQNSDWTEKLETYALYGLGGVVGGVAAVGVATVALPLVGFSAGILFECYDYLQSIQNY